MSVEHDHEGGHHHLPSAAVDHEHLPTKGIDHDHFHEDELGPLEENALWLQENVVLDSVGVDIGSSGTQVVFSRLKLRRNGAGLATRFVAVEKMSLYQSPVAFTPFADDLTIDAVALGTIIDEAYAQAGVDPERVDTGVVILTGEALRRTNAERIAAVVADRAGDFVCATAGHHMEACLAAFGSGAVRLSGQTGKRILNVDIGGGTTKLSLIVDGEIASTAALHLGGRLMAADADGRLIRLESAAQTYAQAAGLDLHVGDAVTDDELEAVAAVEVELLVAALASRAGTAPADGEPASEIPWLTAPIAPLGQLDGLVFSGGVAEYVYETEDQDFGDLGLRLGRLIRARLGDHSLPSGLLDAQARIRATALGATEFSVQLSGSTCYVSDPAELLPRRNLRVIRPSYALPLEIDPAPLAATIRDVIEAFAVPDSLQEEVVLALAWSGPVTYPRLRAFAEAVAGAVGDRAAAGAPVLLAVDADIGHSLGAILHEELAVASAVMVVDGLHLLNFDYIDLGRPLQPSNTIPVTIKSLVFSGMPALV